MKTVMIVDDDDGMRGVLIRFFEQGGYIVLTATNGKIALDELIQRHTNKLTTNLVITDENMPEMGGPLLLQKTREAGLTMPFVLIGGYVDERAEQLKAAGFTAVLGKPINSVKALILLADKLLA